MRTKHPLFRFLLIFMISSIGCQSQSESQDFTCTPINREYFYSQNAMTAVFPRQVVEHVGKGSLPDSQGAMGRNEKGYFHVRFQMGISAVTNFGIVAKGPGLIEKAILAIEYSFAFQDEAGNFKLVVPPEFKNLGTPKPEDEASGIAFFASSLGSALLAMQESDWFNGQQVLKQRIMYLQPNVQKLLQFLKTQVSVLQKVDAKAPNRLLFDAVAFYSLGSYLNDVDAKRTGIEFAKSALALQHQQGYYLEGGGWDSSYQGVALENGFKLLTLLTPDDPFQDELFNSLACGSQWELSRIKASGKISTESNTRVYDGGEKFLGQEKKIAYKSVVIALFQAGLHTNDKRFIEGAEKVIAYYK